MRIELTLSGEPFLPTPLPFPPTDSLEVTACSQPVDKLGLFVHDPARAVLTLAKTRNRGRFFAVAAVGREERTSPQVLSLQHHHRRLSLSLSRRRRRNERNRNISRFHFWRRHAKVHSKLVPSSEETRLRHYNNSLIHENFSENHPSGK